MTPIDQAERKGDETQEYGDEAWPIKGSNAVLPKESMILTSPRQNLRLHRIWKTIRRIFPELQGIMPPPAHTQVQGPANAPFLPETFPYVWHNPPPDRVEFFRDRNTEKQGVQNTNHSPQQ